MQVRQDNRLNAMTAAAMSESKPLWDKARHERDGETETDVLSKTGVLSARIPYRRIKGDTGGSAWVASSTTATVCRCALPPIAAGLHIPMPGVSSRAILSPDNTAQ